MSKLFSLTKLVARHPISDKPYMRHLETSDAFNEVRDARAELDAAIEARDAADQRVRDAYDKWDAARAKADLTANVVEKKYA